MIKVSRLKDLKAAELFLGFRIGPSVVATLRFSSTGSTRSSEAEELVRQQDVRWRADGHYARSIHRTPSGWEPAAELSQILPSLSKVTKRNTSRFKNFCVNKFYL